MRIMSKTSNLCIVIGAVALVMLMHLSTVRCAPDREDDIKSSLQQLSASILDIYEDVTTVPERGPALRARLEDPNLGSKVRVLRETTSRRKDLLKAMIVRDPEAALKFMYNHEVLYNLRRFMRDTGETDIALENLVVAPQADYYVISASDEDVNKTESAEFSTLLERYIVVPANDDRPEQQYKAFVYGEALEKQSSRNVHVVGLAVDDVLAIDDQRSRLFDFSAKMAPSMSSSMYTYGTKSVLFIRVDFNDKPGDPVSESQMNSVFTQCKSYFYDASYGKMTLGSWKITPTLRMPRSSGSYQSDPNSLLRDATSAAQQRGFSTSQYSFYAVGFAMIYPGWAGKGFVGMPGIWYNGAFQFRTVAHELGHNLGLWHANFYISQESPASAFGGRGTVAEYGDISDLMGAGITVQNHFNLRNKIQIGWASSSAIQTVTSSGTYTIYAHDDMSADNKLRGLQIPYSNSINYLISFRSKLATGIYANKALDVHMTYSTYSSTNSTHMIDTTPGSGQGRLDAPIAVGATFTGPGGSPKITFTSFSCSTTPCTATVSITVGGGRSYYYSPGSGGGSGGGSGYTPPRPTQPSQPPREERPGYPGGAYPGEGYWSQ